MAKLSNFFLGKRFLVIILPALACLLTGFFLLNYFLPAKAADLTCQEDPESWYLNRWIDVKADSYYGTVAGGGLKHFCENGKNEGPRENCFGRDACPSIPPAICSEDPEAWYLNRWLDVKNDGYGQLINGGLKHYCDFGKNEGRENCFASNACGMADTAETATITPTLICSTDRMLFSVASYGGRIYAGSYTSAMSSAGKRDARLYDCSAGGTVAKQYTAESVYSLSENNGALYMSLEGGGGNPGNGTVYKFKDGNFKEIYRHPTWSLMLGTITYNGSVYAGVADYNSAKTAILKCPSNDSCYTLTSGAISNIRGGYTAFGVHNNELYVAKLGYDNQKTTLSKIDANDNVTKLLETTGEYGAPTSFKGSLYYTLSNNNDPFTGGTRVKVYKYPNIEVGDFSGYSLGLWMGVSGDYLYVGVGQSWQSQTGGSALYRSKTAVSGSWEKVTNFEMPTLFSGYVDSDGTIYIAGGRQANYGKIYKVTLGSSIPVPTISSFTATPSSITSGQTATLTWSTFNATSLSISGLGAVTGTTRQVTPTVTTTYTLTATNAGGSATKSVTVTVDGTGDAKTFSFISNGKIKIGVIKNWGASVGYLSRVDSERNLINSADKGREMQQSYYGSLNGLTWNNAVWRWNPVQAGDTYGNSSTVQSFTNDGSSIYARTIPKDWAANNVDTQGYMEQWITLNNDTARIHYKFTYTGNSTQDSYNQELPALFVDYDLPNLVSYRGNSPWSNGSLTSVVPGNLSAGATNFTATEPWTAYVDNNNWGIGMYTPGSVNRRTSYRHYNGGTSGPNGDSCSYVAPISTWSFSPVTGLNKGPVYEYDVYLTIGTLNDVRSRFYAIHGSAAPTISSFTASPASITSGQTATLSWSAANATSLSISGLGAVTGATRQVTPTQTTTYTLTATNANGSATKNITVTVGTPPAPSSTFRVFTHNPTKAYFSVYADGNTIHTGTYADNIGSLSTYYSHYTTFNTSHQQTSSCSALNVESFFRVRKFKGSIYATVEHGNYLGNEGGPRDKGGIWKFDNGSWQFKHAVENHELCLDMVANSSNIYAACARTFVVGDGNIFENIVMPNGSSAIRLAELNGKVYIAGNTENCDWGCGSGVMYIYENGSLTAKTPPHNLSGWGLHGITAFKGKIYVATVSNENYAYIYRYDPDNGLFTEVKRVEGKGITHWMGTDGNYVYAAVAKDFVSADLYRSADGVNWNLVANLPGGLAIDGTVDANGYMYIAGGKFQGRDGYIWWNGPTESAVNSGCSVGQDDYQCIKDPEAWYLNKHTDVRDAGVGALEHYCNNGKKENRANCFAEDACESAPPATCQEDPEAWYFYRWLDVKASAYGQMSGGALKHFCEHGKNEGPRENCFGRDACASAPPATCLEDPEAWYLNRHPDVKNDGYGQLVGGGLKHFCEHGRDEGPRENCFAANVCGGTTPDPTCTNAGPDDWRVKATSGTKTVYAYGVTNASGVSFAVWTTANGQDDLIWYEGIDAGGGTWQADIDLSKHTGIDIINVHVYLQHGSVWCDEAKGSRIDPGLIGGGNYVDTQTVKVYYSTGPGITGQWWCDNHFGGNLGGTWECISVSGGSCSQDAQLNSEVTCGRMAAGGNTCQANPESWYLNRWPDVKADAYYGTVPHGGLKHFCEHGKNESRENCFDPSACGTTPPPPSNNCQANPESWYLNRWPDVKADAYYGTVSEGGKKHFCEHGKNEGPRENCFAANACGSTPVPESPPPAPTCQADPNGWYLNRWPDVKNNGGFYGLDHWCRHGRYEGPRESCFSESQCSSPAPAPAPAPVPSNNCQSDPNGWYLNRWPDVKADGGFYGLDHWCAHGRYEGPRESCFSASQC